jgi:hypothetical protein
MLRKYCLLCAGTLVLLITTAKTSLAQTQINLQNQGRDVDFSAAPSTKPAQTGTSLPTTCSPGAVYLLLNSIPGQNLYVCTTGNVWSLQTGGSGSSPNALGLSATGSALSIGANCSAVSPCNVRVGSTVFAFSGGMTASISAGSGTAYVYVSSDGLLTVGHSMTVSCSAGCVAQSGITGFPSDSYPIAIWTASNGTWSGSGVDTRAAAGRDLITAGSGLNETSSGVTTTLSLPSQENGFAASFRGTDVAPGNTLYLTLPHACTITDWAITSDGTATIMLWRISDGGTDLPHAGDSISTNGFSLTTGKRIHSTTLTDLTSTSIYAFDTFGVNLLAETGASHVEFYLGCTQ